MASYRRYENRERKLKCIRNNGLKLGYRRTEKGYTTYESVLDWFNEGLSQGFSIMQDPQSRENYYELKTLSEREEEKTYRECYLKGSKAAKECRKMPKL
ncbi:MAG TPA: hypothetical protein GX708_24320 [Gallicola sp.]|nr:hypothetical protein [Gallicola sp.]